MSDAVPEGPVGVYRTRVQWIDTDAAGIYHNATVVRYVEAAEAVLMFERGLQAYFPVAPRVRYEAEFIAPMRFGQEVTATVRLVRVGTTSMRFEFEIWGDAHDQYPRVLAARGSYVTVHITGSHESGDAHSTPWPSEWVARLTGPSKSGSQGGPSSTAG